MTLLRRTRRAGTRTVGAFAVALVVVAVLTLPATDAAFRDTTGAAAALGSEALDPPPSASASATLNVLPLLTCRATITWTASPDAAWATRYRLERLAGGSTVATTLLAPSARSHTDSALPLALLGYSWRIRTEAGSWVSPWRTASAPGLLCLL